MSVLLCGVLLVALVVPLVLVLKLPVQLTGCVALAGLTVPPLCYALGIEASDTASLTVLAGIVLVIASDRIAVRRLEREKRAKGH